LPGGEKILAEYFSEKNELLKNLYSNKSIEDDLRNIISNNPANQHGEFVGIQQNEEQDNLINNFKTFLSQHEQFKHLLSTSFSSYMSSMLNQSQLSNNQVYF